MAWSFETVAGPFKGPTGGVCWDGRSILFTAVTEGRVLRFDPATGSTDEFRRYTNRSNGIALGPQGQLYGCQEGSRRIIEFKADGSAVVTATRLNGRYHNFPTDLTIDRAGRIWFSDPYNPVRAYGPQLFPPLDHASVLRLARNERHEWQMQRVTHDTSAPRAVLLSREEKTLYLAEGDETQDKPRELRAYPLEEDGRVGPYVVLYTFGSDHRGPHRGIEGMCLDADGDIIAVGGSDKSGPGPLVYVFSPQGAVRESHALPIDRPMRCAFGGARGDELYVTTAGGHLLRATGTGRRGFARFA